MRQIRIPFLKSAIAGLLALSWGSAFAATSEWNPVRSHPVEIGPQAGRLIVGFRANAANAVTKTIRLRSKAQLVSVTQAQTSDLDVRSLSRRTGVAVSRSQQLTPSMHVMFLQKTVYGADVEAVLRQLRADPSVAFADVDQRRYVHAMPNDPLFVPTATASGQWYMQAPSSLTPTSDAAATDAVSAWNITTGSSGTVIADVDSGIRFDHPDLLRAGLGGRLLPGYDFVSQDVDASNGNPLGTFLVANDGDGWDPDPSDPGDWIDSTDLANTQVFPSKNCSAQNSSWHGTRVMGVLGAVTNNDVGIAGMTWNPYLLPVRALGKCGGLDSDIITGIQWAVGMSVNSVPDNPYPADIINLSLGGTGTCPTSYQNLLTTLTAMGVLVVASAGNESGPVDIPGNCPGVLAVAGLRNVGTKVGYSSLGPEVGIGAPAGNCVNTTAGSPCLRSIDSTVNEGATVPGTNSYTDQFNTNLGTSFSAPIVSGIAALMRAANANLTPPQIIARMQASATPFSQPVTTPPTPQCVAGSSSSVECACTTSTCGAGMVNALSAVMAALNPIAAVSIPSGLTSGSATIDAGGSVAACNATIASYAWSTSGAVSIVSGGTSSAVNIMVSGAGALTLVVKDSAGHTDTAVVNFTANGATSTAPSAAGSAASACIAPMTVTPAAPTIASAFSPASVAVDAPAMLMLTFTNTNGFALTQSGITLSLPAGLTLASGSPASTCSGAGLTLTSTDSSVTLADANIPANGSCSMSLSVKNTASGTYVASVAANGLMTGPAGGNAAPVSATLTVTAAGSGGGGGGSMDWLDIMLIVGVLLIVRGHATRRPPP
ncbi:MAG TPA: S8 family serine peptidase [Steroidobacteraceae bacterium]|jgi:serine protease|nr:S8 family serine peptidase [Steroidobacteraceae bacterium]